MNSWLLVLLGLGVGTLGTLIGAGGGFILVPVLGLVDPTMAPERLTALSLAVVALNALSGTAAYARLKRIDYRSGIIFTIAAMPGAFFGVWLNGRVPRREFDLGLGVFLVGLALYLGLRTRGAAEETPHDAAPVSTQRRLVLGGAISAGVGVLSSLLGIGGGVIHVPALVYVLGFSAHVATATSHFVLAATALAATAVHVYNGDLAGQGQAVLFLGIGVVAGAQLGAALSSKVRDRLLIRALALALLAVGARVIWHAT